MPKLLYVDAQGTDSNREKSVAVYDVAGREVRVPTSLSVEDTLAYLYASVGTTKEAEMARLSRIAELNERISNAVTDKELAAILSMIIDEIVDIRKYLE
jgi:hypothetical protein